MASISILGIIVFFIMTASLITLALGNIGASPSATVTVSNGGENISQASANYQVQNQGNVSCSLGTWQQDIANHLSFLWTWLVTAFTNPGKLLNPSLGTSLPAKCGNQVVSLQAQGLTGFKASAPTPSVTSTSDILATTIYIALFFVGIGILAGLFGAGILAGVVSGVGITIALIYYFQGILNANGPNGVPYFQMPTVLEGIFLGFVASLMIFLILSSINKGP